MKNDKFSVNVASDSVLYVRVSSDKQEEEGASVEAQIMNGQAKARELKVNVRIFQDLAVSATKNELTERPELTNMLRYVREFRPSYVIVYKRDRLARSTNEWLFILKEIAKYGTKITFFATKEPPLGSGPYGAFMETIMMAIAELEAQVLRIRILDTRRSIVLKNEAVINNPAYGFQYDPKSRSYINIPKCSKKVEEMFHNYRCNNKGSYLIAKELNMRGVESPKGKKWTGGEVLYVLKNPFYCGEQRASYIQEDDDGEEERVEITFKNPKIKPLVSKEEFDEVQRIIASRVQESHPREGSTPFILSGRLFCKKCGKPFVAQQNRKERVNKNGTRYVYAWRAYRCNNYQTGLCDVRIPQEVIENVVVKTLLKSFAKIDVEQVIALANQKYQEMLDGLKEDNINVDKKIKDLEGRKEVNQFEMEREQDPEMRLDIKNRIKTINQELRQWKERSANITRDISEFSTRRIDEAQLCEELRVWEETFKQSDLDKRRLMIQKVIERIDYDSETDIVSIAAKLDQKLFADGRVVCPDGVPQLGESRGAVTTLIETKLNWKRFCRHGGEVLCTKGA